jgi:hypothetical protein
MARRPTQLLERDSGWRALRRRADQDLEQVADLALLLEGVTQGTPRHDRVAIASALPLAQQVARFDQLGQDPVGGALGNADRRGDVADADPGVVSHADEDVGVVGQKVPTGGLLRDVS